MKRIVLLVAFLIVSCGTFAQISKVVEIPMNNNSDTSLWYKWRAAWCAPLRIEKLLYSTDAFHFRYWQDGQAVDIWSSDNKTFSGRVTNYAHKKVTHTCKNHPEKPMRLFKKQIRLDSAQAHNVYKLLIEYSILTLPSDNKINNWSVGLDGTEYLIEIAKPESYTFKTYWTPTAQKGVPEAEKFQAFVIKINAALDLPGMYVKLMNELPIGTFTKNGISMFYISGAYDDEFDYENEFGNEYWAE